MNRQRRTLLPSLTLIMSFCFHNADAEPSGKLDTHLELQGRHVYNSYESQGSEDQDAQGFLIRRARADFRGTAVDPDWNARLRANANSADGEIVLEYAYIGFPVASRSSFGNNLSMNSINSPWNAPFWPITSPSISPRASN
jgi:hypothetical protein